MKNMNAACLEMIKENVVDDYFTANIKSEVIFDTLLTPMIPEIIEAAIGVKAKVIAKEFPMLNSDCAEKEDYRNCNADYLLRSVDKQNWYLVELKTTTSSEGKKQKKRYKEVSEDKDSLYKDFVKLLAHIYKVEYNAQEDSLQTVFEKIVKKEGNTWEGTYTDIAVQILKKYSRTGSKKYLYTAARLLEKGVGRQNEETEFKPLEVIYITPKGGGEEKITYISLSDIVHEIRNGEEKKTVSEIIGENNSKREYWEWLKEVFKACYDSERAE